jgi:hypothetical protein
VRDLARSVPAASVMRLLHAEKLCFEKIFRQRHPAICYPVAPLRKMLRYHFKILEAGRKTRRWISKDTQFLCSGEVQGYDWVWIDTCCM